MTTAEAEELLIDVNVRKVPARVWNEVRKAAANQSTPSKRVSIQDVVVLALEEWLERATMNVA